MINAGFIRRNNRRYLLTSFGQVVYQAQELIGKAVQYSSKLKAIDSLETTEFLDAERNKFIDTLINDSEIKEIMITPQRNNNYIYAEHTQKIIISARAKP